MNDYQPIDQKEIERAYFFLTHKALFKKLGLISVVVVTALIYVLLVVNVISIFQRNNFNEIALKLDSGLDWGSYHKARAPQALMANSTRFLVTENGKYTLMAFVENPNQDWFVTNFKYKFLVNGQELETKETFLNPGEKRILLQANYSGSSITDLKVDIGNVSWRRFEKDAPEIIWDIQEAHYFPARTITDNGDALDINPTVSWTAQNMSLYDFWEVGWQVALFDGDRAIGVTEIKSLDFKSLEKRDIEVSWLKDLPRVTKVEIFPVLNWLDKDNFKSYYQEERESDRVNL